MKPVPQFLRPRSAVLYSHTRRMLDQTAMCMRKFATQVAEQYVQLVAPDLRQVPFRLGVVGEDLFRAEKHNAQQISRYMDGTVKVLPADLEDAWVLSLPEPYRSDCERDLARRRGRYAATLLCESGAGQITGICALSRDFADLIQALAPAVADGRLCEADMPHAQRIRDESDDLITAVLSLRRQVTALLPQRSHA